MPSRRWILGAALALAGLVPLAVARWSSPGEVEEGSAPSEELPSPLVGPPRLQTAPAPSPSTARTDSATAPAGPEIPARLLVRVEDPAGAPIALARVRVNMPHAVGAAALLAETDARGEAIFPEAPEGEAWVEAERAGYAGAGATPVLPAQGEARLRLVLRPLVRAAGRVLTPEDTPAAGATVQLLSGGAVDGTTEFHYGAPPLATTRTDAEGRFQLELPPGRRLTLTASLRGCADASVGVRLEESADGVELRLTPAGQLTGIVSGPSGEPEAHARVWVVPDGVAEFLETPESVVAPGRGHMWWEVGADDDPPQMMAHWEGVGAVHVPRRVRTDAGGRYRVQDLALGRYRVLAQGPGGARGASDPIPIHAASSVVDVQLEPRVTLIVRCLAPDGAPAGAASLQLGPARSHFLDPRPPPGEQAWLFANGDSEGLARIDGLVGGTYELAAEIPGALPERLSVVLPAHGEHEVTVRGRAGMVLEGRIIDPRGLPVEGVTVTYRTEALDRFGSRALETISGSDGGFEFAGLDDAPATVSARGETHLTAQRDGVRPADTPVRLVVAPRTRVRFRLVAREGEALTDDVWVRERTEGGEERERVAARTPGGDYQYVVQGEDTGVLLIARPRNGARIVLGRVIPAPGAVVDLGRFAVDDGRTVRGSVRDAAGRPLAGARVRAEVPGLPEDETALLDSAVETRTGADGRFVLPGVQHGDAVLVVEHEAAAPAHVLHPEGGEPVRITLASPASLSGTLVLATGRPATGHWIVLRRVDASVRETVRSASVDDAGHFAFDRLAPGRYEARLAGTDGLGGLLGDVEVGEGHLREVAWEVP